MKNLLLTVTTLLSLTARAQFFPIPAGAVPYGDTRRNLKASSADLSFNDSTKQMLVGITASALLPAYSFPGTGNNDNGLWRSGTDQISLVTNGQNRLTVLSTGGIDIPSGLLGVTSGSAAVINLNGATGSVRDLRYLSAGSLRWIWRVNATAEAGANAGSDFELLARDDTAGAIDTPISITRASGGAMTVARPLIASRGVSVVRSNTATAASVNNLNCSTGYAKLTGATVTSLEGIAAPASPVTNRICYVWNNSGAAVTFANQNVSAAANDRIVTPTGADMATTGNGAAILIYDDELQRWVLVSFEA